jgi:predicted dehydrogenase
VRGVAGSSAEKAADFVAHQGVPRPYRTVDELCGDPDVQVVHLCTPPHTHVALTRQLASAGKHILVDKPLARTVADADAMIATCANAGVLLGGLFQHRFIPICAQVHEAVTGGALGRLHLADCYVKWWRDDQYYAASAWKARWATEGGGALINQAIHSIDLLQWLAGPVVEVSGRITTAAHEIETEDLGVAILRCADGAMGVIEASTATYPGFPERLELHGSRGSVILNEGRREVEWHLQGQATRIDRQGTTQGNAADPAAVSPEAHAAAFADFAAAVRDGRQPAVPGGEARKALAIVEAIYRSAASGGSPQSLEA